MRMSSTGQPDSAASLGGFWLPLASLWSRELVRFLRQPSRIAGLLAAPLLFWLFIGAGLGGSFRSPSDTSGSGYLQYFFPGTVVMIVLFTSVFANMSTIEDRREGFLQSVLVAPIPRVSLILGKILGGTTQAMVPGSLFLLLSPLAGFSLNWERAGAALVVLFLVSFSLGTLGFALAWWIDSMQGFHAILNLVLIPLWLLSGALFPAAGASRWLQWIMRANPLTYELAALREVLSPAAQVTEFASLRTSLAVTLAFSLLSLAATLLWSGRATARHLG
jgi:ABC-2 type transport system permease protein